MLDHDLDLNSRIIKTDGTVILKDDGILEVLFNDDTLLVDSFVNETEETEQYNKWAKIFGMDELLFHTENSINHKDNQNNWIIPHEFMELDIEEYVLSMCNTEEQLARVKLELELYRERNLFPLLKFITYIVEVMRDGDIVWGIGRGSSVSSYILYLLGLHKIDSLFYDLDIKEFLK